MHEQPMKEPESMDELVRQQPTMEQLLSRSKEQIAPFVKKLDDIRGLQEVYKGGQYYFALKDDKGRYAQWGQKIETAEEEYRRTWEKLQQKYRTLTGQAYTDSLRWPQVDRSNSHPAVLDKHGKASADAIDAELARMKLELHSAIAWDWRLITEGGAATGKLGKGVSSPQAFIQEMSDFRRELLDQDASAHAQLPPQQREERAGAFSGASDEVYGFHRTARGFGLAALEAGDYEMAGQAIGFCKSIATLPEFEEQQITNIVRKASPAARAQFAEGMRKFTV